MKMITEKQAVIYARVSTKKQSREGSGLDSQETRCREYAAYRGYRIVKVFQDDMSGSMLGRPGITAMLAFVRKHRRDGIVVIIDDISRLARGLEAHLKLRTEINKAGGVLESPSIEFGEDSDSTLVEHLLASVSQHQRQKNGEQAKNRMRARMLNGFWVFYAPLGYVYQKSPAGGSVLVPDEPMASAIREALEGFADGRLNTKADVKRHIENSPGARLTRHGILTNEQAHRILTRPIYAGYIESKVWGVSFRKGQHEPLISLETYQRIQEKLSGKIYAPARTDINEDFPLRGFVTCGECGHPLTANWSKGRYKAYPYYVCRHRGCEKFGKSVSRDKVEGAFEGMLRSLRPSQSLFSLIARQCRIVWDKRTASMREAKASFKLKIAAVEKKIDGLLDRIVESENGAVVAAYERKVAELEREKHLLAEKQARCGTVARDYDETFRTAFEFLSNPCYLWEKGGLEDKRIVLQLTLDSHLEYDWNQGVRTTELSFPFRMLGDVSGCKNEMAETEGFEPSIPR
ncbi:MAG: recombinase family protein [Tsuneonella suprasediminis]